MPNLAHLNLHLGTQRMFLSSDTLNIKSQPPSYFAACWGGSVKKVMFIDVPQYATQTFTLDVVLP